MQTEETPKPQLTTLEKLAKVAEMLNNKITDNSKLKFDFSQEHYYLAYDFNARFITQLASYNAFKIQGVIYCLSPKFKETAIKWITEQELENYLKG